MRCIILRSNLLCQEQNRIKSIFPTSCGIEKRDGKQSYSSPAKRFSSSKGSTCRRGIGDGNGRRQAGLCLARAKSDRLLGITDQDQSAANIRCAVLQYTLNVAHPLNRFKPVSTRCWPLLVPFPLRPNNLTVLQPKPLFTMPSSYLTSTKNRESLTNSRFFKKLNGGEDGIRTRDHRIDSPVR